MNHAPMRKIAVLSRTCTIPGLSLHARDTTQPIMCAVCGDGKEMQRPHEHTTNAHRSPAEITCSHTVGPINPPSSLKHCHILTFLYKATRFYL